MKKRRRSQDILFKRRSNKSKRKGLRKRKEPEWTILAKIRRYFDDGYLKITVPDEINIFDNVAEWYSFFSTLTRPQIKQIQIDFTSSKFIYPEGVVYLSAICDHLLSKTNITIIEKKPDNEGLHDYLNVAGLRNFFKAYNLNKKTIDPKLLENCIPISRDPADKASTSLKITNLLTSHVPQLKESHSEIDQAMGEIMGNAIEHGEVKEWYRVAQIHPTRKSVTIAIADNGVGIPTTLRRGFEGNKYKGVHDSHLIKLSLRSDVTRYEEKFGESHGYGLTCAMTLSDKLGADLAILSGKGLYRLKRVSGAVNEDFLAFNKSLPGTLIVLRIPFDGNTTI